MQDPGAEVWVVVGFGIAAVCAIALVTIEARRARRRLGEAIDGLATAHAEVRTLLDGLPDAAFGLDADATIVSANARAAELTGRSVDELVGRSLLGLIGPDDRDDVTERWRRLELQADDVSMGGAVFDLVGRDGDRHLVEASVHRVPSTGNGGPLLAVLLRDVTAREQSSAALEAARRRFQQAFHSAPSGMALVRLGDNRIIDVNQALADMLDHSRRYLLGRSMRELTHPDDLRAAAAERARIELGIDDGYRLEQRYLRRDGEYVWTTTRVALAPADVPDPVTGEPADLMITHIEDITEQRAAAERLNYAATHDDLTDLPNRASIVARLDELLATAGPGEVAVLFIDLDNFKVVNDSLGHRVGDELLCHVASRFRSVMREGDQVARFGGDEFVVFVDGTTRQSDHTGEIRLGPIDPSRVAQRLRRSVADAVSIDGHELVITASIGSAINHRPAMSADELLRDADAAMYRAKSSGRDRVEAFSDDLRHESIGRLRTSTELRQALAGDEIVAYFQPIVDARTGEVTKHEVLARWRHPVRGVVGPDEFLDTAEAAGLVTELGERILRDALAHVAWWRSAGRREGEAAVAINLAAQQLLDPDFFSLVVDALATSGIEADAVWFEITETALLTDVAAATAALRRLRGLGVHLAVDDFGTGYSSLTYLKHFPVEAIKIDRSFVAGLGIDSDDGSIVAAVVDLGHALGLTVTAEGVESPLQLEQLKSFGCDELQGYLFGAPAPPQHDAAVRTVDR